MAFGVTHLSPGQLLYETIERDAAMLGEDLVDATYFRHEGARALIDARTDKTGSILPLLNFKADPTHGQALAAFLDGLLAGAPMTIVKTQRAPA
jgi:hypothetical protein